MDDRMRIDRIAFDHSVPAAARAAVLRVIATEIAVAKGSAGLVEWAEELSDKLLEDATSDLMDGMMDAVERGLIRAVR